MTRILTNSLAMAITWIAREMIYLGQTIIRMAYEWLEWSERQ